MRPIPFVWPYAPLFWAVFVWAYVPEFRIIRNARRDVTAVDAKSLQVIMAAQNIAFLVAFYLAWKPIAQLLPEHRVAVFFVGTALLFAGSILRRHCWRMLGKSFTGDVRASADQEVVTRGAYSLLRHPSYTAGIIMNTALGIALGSLLSALILGVVSFLGYSYRIKVEERVLLSVIGEPYERFMRTRKRLIPFVY